MLEDDPRRVEERRSGVGMIKQVDTSVGYGGKPLMSLAPYQN